MTTAEIKAMATKYVINTYGERPISIVRGEGAYVWDAEGKRYLDFVAGIATLNVGHCHPKVVGAIVEQAKKLLHVSNLYYMEPQARLAKKPPIRPERSKGFTAMSSKKRIMTPPSCRRSARWGSDPRA